MHAFFFISCGQFTIIEKEMINHAQIILYARNILGESQVAAIVKRADFSKINGYFLRLPGTYFVLESVNRLRDPHGLELFSKESRNVPDFFTKPR